LLTLADPFPSTGGVTPPASLNILSPDLVSGYLQHWNFNVQRSAGGAGVLNFAYAGSKGTHLTRSRDLNQPAPGPGDVQGRRPIPAFSNTFYVESASNSIYNSFQGSLNRSMTKDVSLIAAYTFGKSIDDTSAFLGTKSDKNFPQNSRNYRAERAVSAFDVKHRLSLATTYSLPAVGILRNTEFHGIFTAQAGQPFTPILRFDNSNTGNSGGTFGSDRPDLLRNPELSNHTPEKWFETAAFRVPAPYTFGSAGRNIVRAPGQVMLDLSATKGFSLGDRSKLTFEVQGFNVLNRTNFNLPEMYADEPTTFGRIFAAKAARQLQLVGRFSF
jgi:hypothetical protein